MSNEMMILNVCITIIEYIIEYSIIVHHKLTDWVDNLTLCICYQSTNFKSNKCINILYNH